MACASDALMHPDAMRESIEAAWTASGDPNVWTRRHTVASSSPLTARSASQERSDAVLTHTPRHRDLLPWCP